MYETLFTEKQGNAMFAFRIFLFVLTVTVAGFQTAAAAEDESKEILTTGSLGTISSFTRTKPEKIHLQGTFGIVSADYSRGAYDGIKESPEYWGGSASLAVVTELLRNYPGTVSHLYLTVGIENTLAETDLFPDAHSPKIWYESNPHAGLVMRSGRDWQFGLTYGAFTSPNGQFGSSQEIAFTTRYQGESLMMNRLKPQAKIAVPVFEGKGVYTELSVAPGFRPLPDSDFQLTLPVVFGMGINDYYGAEKSSPVYGSIGLVGSLPLKVVPSDYGSWSFSAGAFLLVRETALVEAGRPLDDAGNTVVYGSASLSFVF